MSLENYRDNYAMTDSGKQTAPFFWDIGYKSLNHDGEELCGDRVKIVETEHSRILILADGMGSGVKANIFSTLTSTILATMLREGSTIDEALDTVMGTLPICQERQTAYCTFTVLQVNDDRSAYLIDYDNPDAILIRDDEPVEIPRTERVIHGKKIKEARFEVQDGDVFAMMSDGCIWCSPDDKMNFSWNRDTLGEILSRSSMVSPNARRIAFELVDACDDEYGRLPADDTTAAVMRITTPHTLKLMTGPPVDPADDERIVKDLLSEDEYGQECTTIVCGGTTAKIVSRIMDKPIKDVRQPKSKEIPPYDSIEGIDLVTEGAVTLKKAISMLEHMAGDPADLEDLDIFEYDDDNGAALIATAIMEDCTHIHLLVGEAINDAYKDMNGSQELTFRHDLVKNLADVCRRLKKKVTITYY